MQNKLFNISLGILFFGGITLDSEGKAYIISVCCCIAGIILCSACLFSYYRNEKRKEENRIARAIQREKRRQEV